MVGNSSVVVNNCNVTGSSYNAFQFRTLQNIYLTVSNSIFTDMSTYIIYYYGWKNTNQSSSTTSITFNGCDFTRTGLIIYLDEYSNQVHLRVYNCTFQHMMNSAIVIGNGKEENSNIGTIEIVGNDGGAIS